MVSSAVQISAGVAAGVSSRSRATTPATCGAAIDVPLTTLAAVAGVEVPIHADKMLTPGAKMSTQEPWLVKVAAWSEMFEAATVMAAVTSAGL